MPSPHTPSRPGPPSTSPRTQPVRRRGRFAVRGLVLAVVCSLALGALPTAQAADTSTALAVSTQSAVDDLLVSLQTKSSASDYRYLENTVWVDGTPTCFRCTLGPSVLAAARSRDLGAGNNLHALALKTMDVAIKDHQRFDGSFGPMGPGEGGYDIQTVMFANELAWTYLSLGPDLDLVHRARWKAALVRASDWLIRNGNLRWYVNGNINLAVAMNMDLTYRITGLTRFRTSAGTALAFTLAPPQSRWEGFGLQYSQRPKRADGSDGSAYLAEKGAGGTGYDPVYTLMQLDLASAWYSMTGNATAGRLTNLLFNQLQPRVRTSDWTIDVSGGTRRVQPGVRYCFCTSALSVLALQGSRTDLEPQVASQVRATMTDYKNATRYPSPGLSYGYAMQLVPMYRAVTGRR